MNYLYFKSKILEWVYNKIFNPLFNGLLKPIVDFLSDLFTRVFNPIFNDILRPILQELLDYFIDLIVQTFEDFILEPLFQAFQYILRIIDGLGEILELFAGRGTVTFRDGTTDNFVKGMVLRPAIKNVFVTFFFVSLLLLVLFTLLALLKSHFDTSNNAESMTPAKVFKSLGKSIMTMASGPLLILGLLLFSVSLVNTSIDLVTTQDANAGGQVTYGSALLVASSINWNSDYTDFDEPKRSEYLHTPKSYNREYKTVKNDLGLTIPKVLIGILISIMTLFPMIGICYSLIMRVLDIAILFLIFPFFASTIPLDDGERYKRWKDMMIARVFVSNGTVLMFVVSLYLYLPWTLSLHINLGSKLAAWLMRMVLVVAAVKAMDSFPKLAQGLFSYEGASIDAGNVSAAKNAALDVAKKVATAIADAYTGGAASAAGGGGGFGGGGGGGGFYGDFDGGFDGDNNFDNNSYNINNNNQSFIIGNNPQPLGNNPQPQPLGNNPLTQPLGNNPLPQPLGNNPLAQPIGNIFLQNSMDNNSFNRDNNLLDFYDDDDNLD